MNSPQPQPQPRKRIATTLAALSSSRAADQVFDVVIVGSGYGGSLAAWVLSQCRDAVGQPLRVCLLERGNEFLPGDFPGTFAELPRELRLARQSSGKIEGHQGLFDLRIGDDVMALVANGLGGGSLINAGVMLEPTAADCADPGFANLINELDQDSWFTQAKRLLGAEVRRADHWVANDASRWRTQPLKTQALEALAQADAAPLRRPSITVCLDGQPSLAQTELAACNHCGDCMTGCNTGAKDSLDIGLLSAAHRGAVPPLIVTGATVTSVLRDHGRWALRVAHTDPTLQLREGYSLRLLANRVILAAGTLGSPEILLRSRDDKLVFSKRLGQGFSCNGDNIGAVRGLPTVANACADEDQPAHLRSVGPTITGSVRLNPVAGKAFELQDFSVPGPLARLFDETVTSAATIQQMPLGDCSRHDPDQPDPLAVDAVAMARTLLVGVIGHDAADGSLVLANPMRPLGAVPQMGALRIIWPAARDGAELHAAHDRVSAFVTSPNGGGQDKDMAKAKAPTFIANPMWRLLPPELAELISQPRGPVLTVHPLGGCGIGSSVETGVVDSHGRVFDAAGSVDDDAWHGSLVVLDGAIVPSSLGANPALTISALTLRALDQLVEDWDLDGPDIAALCEVGQPSRPGSSAQIDGPITPAKPPPVRRTEVAITERLRGEVTLALGPGAQPKTAVVELTLAFKPTAVRTLSGPDRQGVGLEPNASRMRVWDPKDWMQHDLRFATDHERARYLKWDAPLTGSLKFMQRERSSELQRVWRAARAWLCNRGLRDLYQRLVTPYFTAAGRAERAARMAAKRALPRLKPLTTNGWLRQFLALASHAGEVRRFDYLLTLGAVNVHSPDWAPPDGQLTVQGEKRLTYNRRASPWRQLTELTLLQMPGLRGAPALLKLDPRFLAAQAAPLLALAHQRNHAEALAELLSFGLYFFRVLVSVHLWTFRKPDAVPARVPQRLPGDIARIPSPQVIELVVDRWPADSATPGAPLSIRLTRYARPGSKQPALVMLHGYSVSGNTFTHPALKPSAAAWFWERGREVWVVDLRTSSGLASATYPWAMEQPALIDIPAALLHIRQASGQRIDVLAHCIGCAMLSMAMLTDAKSVRDGSIELGVDAWLTSEHFGTLTAFNGASPSGGQHPTIARIVLSQKGPLLRYTDANVLRAHVMQYARRWLLADDYQFKPSPDPGVAEQLLDRFLASLPYPDADYDIENPRWPCAQTPWTATRHRMDALYGRDFSADNMSDEVLKSIDDLFGPINLDTVSQTIHFSRFSAITNQRGRGEFVTQGRLRDRWGGIPTLAIHGRENGLIDVGTEDLLLEQFGAASVPLLAKTYDDMGHQDVLIGLRSTEVFDDIGVFLDGGVPLGSRPPPPRVPPAKIVVISPWVGPRVLMPDARSKAASVACIARPDQGKATMSLAPAWRRVLPSGEVSFELLLQLPASWVKGDAGLSGHWLKARPGLPGLMSHVPATPDGELGWLAVFAYDADQLTAMASRHVLPHLHADVPAATQAWIKREPVEVVARSFVRLADLKRAEGLAPQNAWNRPLRFAVASCQYPHGLFDPTQAGASLTTLAGGREDVDLALLLGDQIYSDASAGLVDPTRSDELYAQPHERALRTPAMAAVMRRMPTPMLLDDHELEDNWEPLPADRSGSAAKAESDRLRAARVNGMAAYYRFQRPDLATPPNLPKVKLPSHADFCFQTGGHAFYLLDTRTARQRGRPSQPVSQGSLIDPDQFVGLEVWLEARRDQVKFVCTPSLLLPRRVLSARDTQNATYSDAWCGYPGGLSRLLRFLAANQIRNTVFLSGDEHHAMHAEVTLGSGADAVKVLSVHSSALYAPFPFANGRPCDLQMCEAFVLDGLNVQVHTTRAPAGDGFAVLEVVGEHSAPVLHIAYQKAGQLAPTPIPIRLGLNASTAAPPAPTLPAQPMPPQPPPHPQHPR